jgi:Phage Tail Collar Domain/Collagen triple helix repeat (20 copies)
MLRELASHLNQWRFRMPAVRISRPTTVLVVVTTAIALVVGGLAGWGGSTLTSAHTAGSDHQQLGCVDVANKTITLISPSQSCKSSLLPVVWQTGTAKNGATGPAGAKGDTGATGAKGDTGAPGATGATGANGARGATGAKGEAGTAAAKGDPGATGATGDTGATGAKGDTGATGVAAWSAVSTWDETTAYTPGPPASIVTYQGGAYVAVVANVGATPSAVSSSWAQIAAPGQIGAQGPQGNPGPAGPAGADGANGTNGTDGTDGAAGAAGSTGPTGPAGPPGPAGPQGTPGNNTFASQFGSNPQAVDGSSGEECTMGEVMLTAGNVANGMVADGRILQISTYGALFSLIGTQFGGNGQTTFALPDLRSLAPNGLTYSICYSGLYPVRS